MDPYRNSGYGGSGKMPGHSPSGYGGSYDRPGSDHPPPQYTPPGQAPPRTPQGYPGPSPSGGSPYAPPSPSPATYDNSQAVRGPYASYTESYPASGRHASDPRTHSASRGPHTHDTGSYARRPAFPSTSTPENSAYYAPPDGGLHSNVSQPPGYGHQWQSGPSHPSLPSPPRNPGYRGPEYSSSRVPENRQYHSSSHVGLDANIPTTHQSPAGRGGNPPADTSNAIPVSDFNMRQTVRARITADTWVMGVIIGVAHIASKFTGRTYLVEFESVEGRRTEGIFSEEELRPCTRKK